MRGESNRPPANSPSLRYLLGKRRGAGIYRTGAPSTPAPAMTAPRSSKNLRIGLIGFGLGGASFHAPLIAATQGMALATVVTANPERRAQAVRDYPGVQVVTDPDWLWRHAADHDLIVISTPNRSHVPLALQALSEGLPVVIDKPFAPTVAEARQVIAAAQARQLLVSAYHIRRWDSECLTLRRLLEEGLLGRVLRFEVSPGTLAAASEGRLEGARRSRGRWWASLRYRQSSHRPGAASVRPRARSLRGAGHPAAGRGDRRRCVCRPETCERRALASLDQLPGGAARTAHAGDGRSRRFRETARRSAGSRAQGRRTSRPERLGRRTAGTLGNLKRRRPPAGDPKRTRRLSEFLRPDRFGLAPWRAAAGGSGGCGCGP